jgi:hypothetical protein
MQRRMDDGVTPLDKRSPSSIVTQFAVNPGDAPGQMFQS